MEIPNEVNNLIDKHITNKDIAEMEAMTEDEKLQTECDRMNRNSKPIFDTNLYDCPKCHNSGIHYIIKEYCYDLGNGEKLQGKTIVGEMCECFKIRESLKLLAESGLTKTMQNETFESYKTLTEWQKEVKIKAQQFISSECGCFYIGGFTGSGKTKICTCILNEFLKQKKSVRYIVWNDFISEILGNLEMTDKKVEEMQKVDVLYIDDLYKFEPKDFEKKVLFRIVNFRARNGMKTLFSSELKLVNCEEQHKLPDLLSIDMAVAGRIYESAGKGEFVIAIENNPKNNMRFKEI